MVVVVVVVVVVVEWRRGGGGVGITMESGALLYRGEDEPADVAARVLIISMRLPPLAIGYIRCGRTAFVFSW